MWVSKSCTLMIFTIRFLTIQMYCFQHFYKFTQEEAGGFMVLPVYSTPCAKATWSWILSVTWNGDGLVTMAFMSLGWLTKKIVRWKLHVCSVAQSCPTHCDPLGCSLPGSSVYGIFQARILEWAAIFSSRGSSSPTDHTLISCVSCTAGGFFTDEPSRKP